MRSVVIIIVLALAVMVAGALALFAYRDITAAFNTPLPLSEPVQFTVEKGATMRVLADRMAAKGWLRHPRVFAWHARRLGKASKIKAGTYQLTSDMSPLAALDLFVSGREIQFSFAIIEGWTIHQLLSAIATDANLKQTLNGVALDKLMQHLGAPQGHPEGMFHADTYHFTPGTSDVELLQRALAARNERLDQLWGERAGELPFKTPYEALILASIVEKETAVADERARIAGVFVSRLRRGMRLETDPTVIYGMGERFDGNIRRRDLRTDTPYNTYTRDGLPPTPIAMVGDDALVAALNPEVDGMLFFVARGDGRHHFSRNYKEHRRAVQRYQIRRRSAPKAAQ